MHFGEYELFLSLISLSPLSSVHPKTFQRQLVRPSIPCYRNFSLTKDRSQSFASTPTNYTPYFRLAFASAPTLKVLTLLVRCNSQAHYAKGTPSSRLSRTPTGCKRTVSGTISLPCSGCFSPFPHGTGSLSVSQKYLALRDGPRSFRQDFTCPALLRILSIYIILTCTGLSPSMIQLSRSIPFYIMHNIDSPSTPTLPKQNRFGLFPVRSPLLRESLLFSFPPGTKMFQFSGFAPRITTGTTSSLQWVAPFGNQRIYRIFAPPRCLSQLVTSFFASESQGIHHALLFTFLSNQILLTFTFYSNMSKNFMSLQFPV